MAETTLLRTSAIVQNASIGTSRPSQVTTGALPLVQVKMSSAGPQIQEGQQRPVQILPSKDPNSAVRTGALPQVQVKMTQNGPQLDDGQNRPVLIRDNKQTVAAGGLPMVQVKMDGGRPQVQNVSNLQGGPPQIQRPAAGLSQPRVMRVVAPQQAQLTQTAPPQVAVASTAAQQGPDLTIDQLLFLRFIADKCLVELRADVEADAASSSASNAKLAEDAIFVLDQQIAAASAQAEQQVAQVEAPIAVAAASPVRAVPAGGYRNPAAYPVNPVNRTMPTGGYVAQRPGVRTHVAGVRAHGNNASMAPRRVMRPAGSAPLPPVVVKMDGGRAVLQNVAEIAAVQETQAQVQPEGQAQEQAQAQVIETTAVESSTTDGGAQS